MAAVLTADADGVLVRIRDNGPGIAHEDRSRIFEPYFTTKAGGTGLGLAIVHRIVSDHGGTVEVGDAPDGGAELLVRLPVKGPPPEIEATGTDTTALGRPSRPPAVDTVLDE